MLELTVESQTGDDIPIYKFLLEFATKPDVRVCQGGCIGKGKPLDSLPRQNRGASEAPTDHHRAPLWLTVGSLWGLKAN